MSQGSVAGGAVKRICGGSKILLLTVLLLLCAITNRVGFKLSGYALGSKPFTMIFLTVVGSIPVNALGYLYMLAKTGGVLPEFRTFKIFWAYWIIASLNILNGLGIMWANPHVSGYIQCLFSSTAIPMTMLLSAIFFKSRFSLVAVSGVVLIIFGVVYVGSGQPSGGQASSTFWTMVYAAAQFPLAAVSVYQEYTFKQSLNMLHYIHYVTVLLMLDLVLCVPLNTWVGDTASFATFTNDMSEAILCIRGFGEGCEGIGPTFILYIIAMNAGTLVQAVLIKNVSASWVMVLLSLATPLTVMAFACPWIVGESHTEPVTGATFVSAALISVGTLVYRLGSVPAKKPSDAPAPAADPSPPGSPRKTKEVAIQTELSLGPDRHAAWQMLDIFLKQEETRAGKPVPAVCAAGVGLFPSEYTNAGGNSGSLWEEHTFAEERRLIESAAEPLLEKPQKDGCLPI